jgi:MoxR-like ATPase
MRGQTAAGGNLPVHLKSFVGRAGELEVLADLVRANRFVTLLGPAGIGKTRLAQATAARLSGEFEDGSLKAPY